MLRILLSIGLGLVLHFPLLAQQELATHFMRDIWQSSLSNPAFTTDKKIEIGLLGTYLNATVTGLEFGDLVRTDADGVNRVDIPNILAGLEEENNKIGTNWDIETLRFAIKVKELQLSFHHAVHFRSRFNYPKNLAEFVFQGNGAYVGQTMHLGPDIEMLSYNEFAVGAAQKFGKLGLGLRVKYLTGIGNAYTEKSTIDLTTDDDIYQLSLATDIQLNTSTYFKIEDLANFDIDFGDNGLGLNGFSGIDLFTGNAGFGVDLGLTYEVNDQLQLAASVRDIGTIKWTENVNNYRSNKVINYDGIFIDSLLQEPSISLSETLDSLQEIIAFSESHESYSTALPVKGYLSASFKYSDTWTFGALAHSNSYRGDTHFAFALSARARFSKLLSAGASYAIRNERYDNLGLNFALHIGPVSLYAMTDNVLAVIQPNNSRSYNVRGGLSLGF